MARRADMSMSNYSLAEFEKILLEIDRTPEEVKRRAERMREVAVSETKDW